ncbi:MAG: hypothetical protein JWO80_1409 [Bryobacterales bacterium]|nr:hypothetical protein [Bryobacterales bacterium]
MVGLPHDGESGTAFRATFSGRLLACPASFDTCVGGPPPPPLFELDFGPVQGKMTAQFTPFNQESMHELAPRLRLCRNPPVGFWSDWGL